jgi:tetrahydromethanopterin S-methyltransferase subunit D
MTVARCGHGAAVAHEGGGALYAVGGYGGGLTYHASAEVSVGVASLFVVVFLRNCLLSSHAMHCSNIVGDPKIALKIFILF